MDCVRTLKKDSGVSSVQLVLGSPVTLLVHLIGVPEASLQELIDQQQATADSGQPIQVQPLRSQLLESYVPEALVTTSWVYV